MFANEEPQRFLSNVSAADKLFAVFGISSLSTVKAKGIRNLYLLQATRKQVLDVIRPATSSKVGSNNDGSFIAYSLIGGDIGAALIAMTVLGNETFDTRTELVFSYHFRKRTGTVDLNDAVQQRGEKLIGMVSSPPQSTIRVLGISFGQARDSITQAVSVKKVGEISIETEAFATKGYVPQDRRRIQPASLRSPFSKDLRAAQVKYWVPNFLKLTRRSESNGSNNASPRIQLLHS